MLNDCATHYFVKCLLDFNFDNFMDLISLTDHEEHEKAEKKTQAKKKKSKHHHRHHHHKAHFTQDELELRRTKGSELAMEDIDAIKKMGDSSDEDLDGKYFLKNKNFEKNTYIISNF